MAMERSSAGEEKMEIPTRRRREERGCPWGWKEEEGHTGLLFIGPEEGRGGRSSMEVTTCIERLLRVVAKPGRIREGQWSERGYGNHRL